MSKKLKDILIINFVLPGFTFFYVGPLLLIIFGYPVLSFARLMKGDNIWQMIPAVYLSIKLYRDYFHTIDTTKRNHANHLPVGSVKQIFIKALKDLLIVLIFNVFDLIQQHFTIKVILLISGVNIYYLILNIGAVYYQRFLSILPKIYFNRSTWFAK
ncbi:MAG: hypothetical protein WCJ58_04000 [bacterium]